MTVDRNDFMSIQAASDGRGVALVPRMFAEDDITAGRLAVVYHKPVESAGAYYVLMRREQAEVDRIGQFRTWIKEETS
jgi:LysR family transcriptional regulator, glycine cleavage system transcriptional activator